MPPTMINKYQIHSLVIIGLLLGVGQVWAGITLGLKTDSSGKDVAATLTNRLEALLENIVLQFIVWEGDDAKKRFSFA